MVPPDPPDEPERPSTGVPEAPMPGGRPSTATQAGGREPNVVTQPLPVQRSRPATLFGDQGPIRRFLSRWAFPIFVLLVIFVGRGVLLPFVFAGLIAYILAPVIRWMTERKDGTRRMPRGLAIIICYIILISALVSFGWLLIPRLAKDVARIGKEAPALYKKADETWVPQLAHYLEKRFPSLKTPPPAASDAPVVPDVPLPPGTAFTVTPLPDGRFAIQLTPGGVVFEPEPNGIYRVLPSEAPPVPLTLEDKIRDVFHKGIASLQNQIDDVIRFGQRLLVGVIKGVFGFFFILMIAAFMLIDMEKVHGFLRSLFPPNVRVDYDVIISGIDRGLSGVIRGQLVICLVNGVLTYIGLLIFDVKYALILAVVAAAMSLIPIFGSILSSIPIVLAALVSGHEGLDFVRAIAAVLWIVGIHFIEANFLNPKIIGSSAKIHPVVVIFALFLGEKAYGLVGALLAVPVASIISVLFVFFYKKTWKKDPGMTMPGLPP
jgi:predicted PurR-regulated permease PerM